MLNVVVRAANIETWEARSLATKWREVLRKAVRNLSKSQSRCPEIYVSYFFSETWEYEAGVQNLYSEIRLLEVRESLVQTTGTIPKIPIFITVRRKRTVFLRIGVYSYISHPHIVSCFGEQIAYGRNVAINKCYWGFMCREWTNTFPLGIICLI